MNKPDDLLEIQRYVQPDGDRYDATTPPPWDCAEGSHWEKTIFGVWFERAHDLPYCCDPSYERYWCM